VIALTRLPCPSMAQAELTHMERVPIDMARAGAQHETYRAALAEAGAEVIVLPALVAHPDCVFVEDVLISLPEISILTRPGALSRRGEVAAMAAHVPGDRPSTHIEAPGTLDGGDVMIVGRTLYVGQSRRTNAAGIAALAAIVAPHGYKVAAVPVPGALHLKSAVSALSPGLLLINADWIDSAAFAGVEQILVHPEEGFAGNSLTVGNTIFLQTAHARTADRVAATGISVRLIDTSEFAKAEGGLTCMSVIIHPAS
jgi:dimethylargininase